MPVSDVIAEVVAIFIPIVAIVMVFGWLIASNYFESRAKRDYMKERLAAIEKGITPPPPPPGLFDEDEAETASGGASPRTSSHYLLRGLMWSFIGLGVGGALWGMGKAGVALLGLIPLAVGLAYLIYCALEGKKLDERAKSLKEKV